MSSSPCGFPRAAAGGEGGDEVMVLLHDDLTRYCHAAAFVPQRQAGLRSCVASGQWQRCVEGVEEVDVCGFLG